jgi:hypothetical protein
MSTAYKKMRTVSGSAGRVLMTRQLTRAENLFLVALKQLRL